MGSDRRKNIRRSIRSVSFDKAISADDAVQSTGAAAILSGLNALRTLQDAAETYLDDVVWHGSQPYNGDGWAGALIWYRQKGMNKHERMTLFGVWVITSGDEDASADDAAARIVMGTKPLEYSAAVYNAESYHLLIKRDFRTYYGDDGSPPDASGVFTELAYDPANRLGLRREIAQEIERWMRRDHVG